ncbi:AAA family ATPase [Serratia fonticola]|uniref:AAA family ATPase n=1 Tax=Serratia fonticola TaxID=47917 RepID=UPI003AB068A9
MILAHIYIAEHKSIRNLNIKVNGSFNCHIDEFSAILQCIDDTSKYYRDHYCSAIIGPNGVGKSTILDFIELLAIESDSRGVVVFYNKVNEEFILVPINFLEINKISIKAKNKFSIIQDKKYFLKEYDINLIKLNNLPNNKNLLLSNRKKTHNRIHDLTPNNSYGTISQSKKYFSNLLEYFSDSFIQDNYTEDVYFEFIFTHSPSSIIDSVPVGDMINEHYHYSFIKWKNNYPSSVYNYERGNSHGSLFQQLLAVNALSIIKALTRDESKYRPHLLYRYIELTDCDSVNFNTRIVLDLVFTDETNRNLPKEIKEKLLIKDKDELGWLEFLASQAATSQLQMCFELFEKIATILYDHCQDAEQIDLKSIRIDDYHTVTALMTTINKLPLEISQNIKWGWRGISSGESAKTHIFSESYHYLKNKKNGGCNIFLMDEIDLYLHPEWQRKFLSEFITHLSIFERTHNHNYSQIILCTHSPIIISDFLPDDIVSLQKIDDGYRYHFNEVKVTESVGFGNTVDDIYMKGMHLESAFGELSRIKIEKLMESIENGRLTPEDKALVLKIKNDNIKKFFLYHDKD